MPQSESGNKEITKPGPYEDYQYPYPPAPYDTHKQSQPQPSPPPPYPPTSYPQSSPPTSYGSPLTPYPQPSSPYSPPQSKQQVAREKSTEQEKSLALQVIKEANPVGASVLVLNDEYYRSVLQQAQRSFLWALCAAIIGLLFFLAAVACLLLQQPQNISYVSVICGTLVEAISALNFYLYGRASQQLTVFHHSLDRTQQFILANNICELLQDNKEEIRARIILALVNEPDLSVNERKKSVNKHDDQNKQQKKLNPNEEFG
jgi:hypothetical protein